MTSLLNDSYEHLELIVTGLTGSERLDRYVSETAALMSRSQLKLRFRSLVVNGKVAKLSVPVVNGDHISLDIAPVPSIDLSAEDLSLDILFENADVVVINKAAGMVVHPAAGNRTGTLVHGLLFHLNDLKDQEFEDETRPGIVHRLDKDTSGVLIAAKNPEAHEFLSAQFQARSTQKTYVAIAIGRTRFSSRRVEGFMHRDPANRQRFVHDTLEGKSARTDFEMMASNQNYCLLRVKPLTGRTHQIRVHARQIGLPLLADPMYGKPDPKYPHLRLMLHAYKLEICLPGENQAREFVAPIPPDMLEMAENLGFADALLRC